MRANERSKELPIYPKIIFKAGNPKWKLAEISSFERKRKIKR